MNRKHLVLIGAFIVGLWPIWFWYAKRMTDGSDEPFGILALVAGGWLLWRDRANLTVERRELLIAAALLFATGVLSLWLPKLMIAALAMLPLAVVTGAWRTNPSIAAVFVLSLPVMASLEFFLGYPMRLIAACFSHFVLSLSGLEVTRQGTVLFWDGTRVGVDPECSGIGMLWVGILSVCVLCAVRRVALGRAILSIGVGFIAVVVGNCFRVTILFFSESGSVSLPGWAHEGVGVAVFVAILWLLNRFLERGKFSQEENSSPGETIGNPILIPVLAACVVVAFVPFAGAVTKQEPAKVEFPGWPDTWEGAYLEPLPLSESEQNFARDFPGRIAAFSNGPDKLVFRWVTKPTRKLHSSADCLRAVGFRIEKERDGSFLARRDGLTYFVEETISGNEREWLGVSQWFWSAVLGRTKGPWWAVTAIRPVG